MIKKIIVADASPLIGFGKIDQISLLRDTLGDIIIPQSVKSECLADSTRPGALAIQDAIKKKIISVYRHSVLNNSEKSLSLLGQGEADAISLALKLNAVLLIDEKLGRKTAKKLQIPIIGTAGILLLAKKKKIIKKISPLIKELKEAGYYLSNELVEFVLKNAEEM